MCTPSPPSHKEWGPRTQPRPGRHGCALRLACPLVLRSLTCGPAPHCHLTVKAKCQGSDR